MERREGQLRGALPWLPLSRARRDEFVLEAASHCDYRSRRVYPPATLPKMFKKRDALVLAICFALALTFRLVRRSPELLSSDAADLASDVAALLCSGKPLTSQLKELVLFRLGGVQPVVVFIHGLLAKWLDVSLEPTSWEWSTILVSSASSPLAFVAGRRFGGFGAGWAWALFLAASPIHVMLGRNLGAPWAYEIAFQLAILWLTDRHLARGSQASAAALWSTLAVYFWSGNQMLAIFPVLVFAFVAHTFVQPRERTLPFVGSRVFSVWLVLPTTSMGVLLYCTFVLKRGHLHHALFDKQKSWGFYWDNFYSDLVHNLGYVPTWMCLAALASALLVPVSVLDRRRLPLVYALCYALPFVFLVSRATTLTRGYCVYGVTGLLGLVATAPNNVRDILDRTGLALSSRGVRAAAVVVSGVTLVLLSLGSGASVYKWYSGQKLLGVKGFQGSFGRPIGAAAAAGFIARLARTEGAPGGKVFSDAYGGAGLEPPIMRLYFKRPSFVHYDARRMAPWKAFAPRASQVGFAVIRPENTHLVDEYFPGLTLAATIVSESTDGPILLVYARNHAASPVVLSAEEGVKDYASSFTHFCAK